MQVLQRFFDAAPVRDVIVRMGRSFGQWATDEAKDVYRRQGGMRLSDLDSSAVKRLANKLEEKLGLACDLSRCSARVQHPAGTYRLRWHQDCAGMGTEEGIVAWLPLDPLDGTRPTLEIAEPEPLWPHHRDDRRFLIADREPAGSATVLMGLKPGDVVLFSPLAPHRTWCRPEMTDTRLSLDMRLFQ